MADAGLPLFDLELSVSRRSFGGRRGPRKAAHRSPDRQSVNAWPGVDRKASRRAERSAPWHALLAALSNRSHCAPQERIRDHRAAHRQHHSEGAQTGLLLRFDRRARIRSNLPSEEGSKPSRRLERARRLRSHHARQANCPGVDRVRVRRLGHGEQRVWNSGRTFAVSGPHHRQARSHHLAGF